MLENPPVLRFCLVAGIYAAWLTFFIIGIPEFPISLLLFPMIFGSPIVCATVAWSLRQTRSMSRLHQVSFFASIAFFPLFIICFLIAALSGD